MIPIALALIQAAGSLAPTLAGWLGGDKAEQVATKVVDLAKTVTGQPTGDASLAAIQADPKLEMEFQRELLANQVQLATIAAEVQKAEITADVTNTANVNETMRTEAQSDHWPTYSWRPFIGFCFGLLALICGLTVAVAYIGVMFFDVPQRVLETLPQMITAESIVMATMAPVLGIASWFRGRMQADPRVPSDNRG